MTLIFPTEDYKEFGNNEIIDKYITENLNVIKSYQDVLEDYDYDIEMTYQYMIETISAKTGVNKQKVNLWFWERDEVFRRM